MKYRTTKKGIRNCGSSVYKVGYCNLQFLLRFNNPFAYSEGVYGWACDYYRIGGYDGVIISTGYSPIGKALDYSICEEYDRKARAIIENYGLTYEQQKAEVKALLDEFIQRISE